MRKLRQRNAANCYWLSRRKSSKRRVYESKEKEREREINLLSKSSCDAEEQERKPCRSAILIRTIDHLEHERHALDNFRGSNMDRRQGHGLENNNATSIGRKPGGRFPLYLPMTIPSVLSSHRHSLYFSVSTTSSLCYSLHYLARRSVFLLVYIQKAFS